MQCAREESETPDRCSCPNSTTFGKMGANGLRAREGRSEVIPHIYSHDGMNTASEAAGPTTNPAAEFDSVHAGRIWVVVARALTAQAPPWNYVGTPLRLRRRKQISPKKPALDFGIRKWRLSDQLARHEHDDETSVASAHHSPGVLRHGQCFRRLCARVRLCPEGCRMGNAFWLPLDSKA